jgi:predicted transcriptional regulator
MSTIGLVRQVSERYAYILMDNEKWWNRLCSQNRAGKKLHAFVRKNVVGPKKAEMLLFYVTHPVKEIRGFGEFVERIVGDAEKLWNTYGSESCLNSYKEYKGFLKGRSKATFIRFKNLRELSPSIPASVVCKTLGIRRMSQNGRYINKKTTHELI